VLTWICAAVWTGVALLAFVMARNGLAAGRLLPFHERASGRDWEALSAAERAVALALTRSLGLGFLITGLALLAAAGEVLLGAAGLAAALAGLAVVFTVGLAVINHRLQAAVGTPTPWKGSLYAATLTLLGLAACLIWLQ
jgi:hypothetical protein